MQNCKFCGSVLPDNTYFCGYCGSNVDNSAQEVMEVTHPSIDSGLTLDTPPLPSDSPHSIVVNAETGQLDADVTIRSRWPVGEPDQNIQWPEKRQRDESDPLLQDIMLPGMLIGEGQVPPTGNVPVVHGTPQVGSVPIVHSIPSVPNTPPSGPEIAHGAGSSASPPSSAPSWKPQIQNHPETRIQSPHHLPQTPPPHHHPTPTAPEHHEHHRHHHRATHRVPRSHTRWLQGATSKVVVRTTTKWIILLVTVIVVIATSGIIVVLAIPPALTLSGSSTVTAGGILHLHGKGFLPGGSVTFTLDNGLPVSLIKHSPVRSIAYSQDRGTSSASILQIVLAVQSVPQVASKATVSVSTIGTFDATISVNTNWSLGLHTMHATESFGSRTAGLSFEIIAPTKSLIQPTKLLIQQKNFTAGSSNCITVTGSGNLIRGWLCAVTLETNSGDLSWVAASTNPSDQFTPSKGVVHPHHSESVSIFISNEPHCSNATFIFVGPTNTIYISWSCPPH